ncbi:MAG: hypothetical protein WCX95_05485 [Candidatus Gracilibacteria bacterium]
MRKMYRNIAFVFTALTVVVVLVSMDQPEISAPGVSTSLAILSAGFAIASGSSKD